MHDCALSAARDRLTQALVAKNWTYRRAAIRWGHRTGIFNPNREANPPPVESLSVDQLLHLARLIESNTAPCSGRATG